MRQVVLYPDLEDGGFVAEVPSLPGCVSEGATREEALTDAREAIEEWIEAARDLRHGSADPASIAEFQQQP